MRHPAVSIGTVNPSLLQSTEAAAQLPDDPGQEIIPSPSPSQLPHRTPGPIEADRQSWVGDEFTLDGHVVVHYRDYILARRQGRLSPIHLGTRGGWPSPGHRRTQRRADQRHARRHAADMHTARFYNVSGSQGIHAAAALRSIPRLTRFSSPRGCCCRPATTATASSTAP
jgi:hypothetical protein